MTIKTPRRQAAPVSDPLSLPPFLLSGRAGSKQLSQSLTVAPPRSRREQISVFRWEWAEPGIWLRSLHGAPAPNDGPRTDAVGLPVDKTQTRSYFSNSPSPLNLIAICCFDGLFAFV